MKYAAVMGSSAMISVQSLINIGSGIQKLIRGTHRHTETEHGDRINLLLLFKNKERSVIVQT
jgi:hypothetical protein